MSRHVLQIARQPPQPLVTHLQSSFATVSRSPSPAQSTSRYISKQPFSRPLIRQLSSRASITHHNATAENTRLAWSGPPASIGALTRFRKPAQLSSTRSLFLDLRLNRTSRRWLSQGRWLSDKRSLDEGRVAGKGSKEHTSSASHEQHAAGAAGTKNILDRLPHIHRPTKYELLAAANGFWQRLRIHFKWFSIRSLRPYTIDEIGAFVSWVFLGHVIWIIVGTTTFVSLAIWAVNTVFAQETLAGWVGNYLTKSSGIKIVFESAIVPTWKDGVITFNNVFVSRRPGQLDKKQRAVSKGSSTTAAAIAAESALAERTKDSADAEDDGNYTQFDVTIQKVNVTLSFSKWFNGKGLLRDVDIHGVRGVIDRTSVHPTGVYVDPRSYLREHDIGDFEIDDFKMSDMLLTVHQPNKFRPFTVSVFTCDLPRLRKQWLFYDFMSANNMSGSFDNSLFTVHPRQVHGYTGTQLTEDGEDVDDKQWKRQSRLRIDGLNIDHLNRGVQGIFGWITQGNVDIVADVMIPNDDDGVWLQSWRKSTEAMSDLYEKVEATVTSAQGRGQSLQKTDETRSPIVTLERPQSKEDSISEANKRFVVLDMKVHLNDVHASIPLFTKDLSYVNNALVRPIVAYINSRRAFIPVSCRVVKRQSEFDGSWTIFDSGLMDDLSRETYDAFARDIEDVSARKRRIKKVGLWTIQLAAQALFIGLAGQLA